MKHYSVILAVFKRKGGEGEFTKIITEENRNNFDEQLSLIEKGERPLICYKQGEFDWLLLTDKKIMYKEGDVRVIIPHSAIVHVGMAIEEERKANTKNSALFTMLELYTVSGEKFILKTEVGKSYLAMLYAIRFAGTGKEVV